MPASESAPSFDLSKAQKFALEVVGHLTAVQMGTLTVIGDRLGLFQILRDSGPVTSAAFALQANIQERYAREWLSAMACHGYIAYDPAARTFTLPPEQAFVLADPDSPLFLLSTISMGKDYWQNLDLLTDAFVQGGGVPQDRFGTEWRCGFERFSRTGFRNNLVQEWIPAMPDVHAKLLAGGTVADVGCGNGQALLFLARGYPNAKLTGFDAFAPSVAAANENARNEGLADRVRYEVCDVAGGLPGRYDLVTTFDVVHDMPRPRPSLARIQDALAPGGTYFIVEFNLSGDLQENIDHPLGIGAFGYSASVNYCMTQALAVGGEGTGTCMGESLARAMAAEAGFRHFRRMDFPNNPFNAFYELRV